MLHFSSVWLTILPPSLSPSKTGDTLHQVLSFYSFARPSLFRSTLPPLVNASRRVLRCVFLPPFFLTDGVSPGFYFDLSLRLLNPSPLLHCFFWRKFPPWPPRSSCQRKQISLNFCTSYGVTAAGSWPMPFFLKLLLFPLVRVLPPPSALSSPSPPQIVRFGTSLFLPL